MRKYSKYMFVFCLLTLGLVACNTGPKRNHTPAINTKEQQTMEETMVAVVERVDTKQQTIGLCDISTGEVADYTYSGATTIYSKKKVAMVADQLTCGQIVDVTYDTGDSSSLKKVQVDKDAWEYPSVLAKNVKREENQITVTGRTYTYDSGISVFTGEQKVMLLDISDSDQLTLRGIGSQLYSITITNGHGYIRVQGQENFLGGTIEVDGSQFYDVEPNMMLTVGAGTHTILAKAGALQAKEEITVPEEMEVVLDLSGYQQPAQTEGRVKVMVSPQDATLRINGKVYRTNSEFHLPFGNYNVRVTAEGYKTYTGILSVQNNTTKCQKLYVTLVEEGATASAASTKQPASTTKATQQAASSVPFSTPTVAGSGQLTIQTPEGAKVYINGAYKGVAPVTCEKITGEITITLSKEGYQTKSYTVNVPTSAGDAEYSFADLQKQSEN